MNKKIRALFSIVAVATLGTNSASFSMDIFEAIYENKFEEIKRLVEIEKVDINQTNKHGKTPLYAILCEYCKIEEHDKLKIVELLIENGADINRLNEKGRTVFQQIDDHTSPKMLRLLLPNLKKETINNTIGGYFPTMLHSACHHNTSIIELLLPHCTKETINKENDSGLTPLYLCSFSSSLIKLLLPYCTKKTLNVTSPLINYLELMTYPDEKTVKLLLEHGASVDDRTLHVARTKKYYGEEKDPDQIILKYLTLAKEYKNAQDLRNEARDQQNKLRFIFEHKTDADAFAFLTRLAFGESIQELEEAKHKPIEPTIFGKLYKELTLNELNKIFDVNVQKKDTIYEFVKKAAEQNYFCYDKDLIEIGCLGNNFIKKSKDRNFNDCCVICDN